MTDDTLIVIKIRENLPTGTTICTLSDLIIPRPNKNTEFSIVKNNFFSIDSKDRLIVSGVIDRDDNAALCVNKNANFSCIWKTFLISTAGFYHILEINIEDENDNAPHWPQNSVSIEITENTSNESFLLQLPKAQDKDEYPNDIHHYEINPSSKYFDILSNKSVTGIKPFLRLKRTVDRELVSWHNITIMAVDGGFPPRTGSLLLFIKILDENDNSPVFESSVYTKSIDNNLTVNDTLDLNIRATDLDVDANGNVTYQFSLDIPFIVQSCFDINHMNGVLRIRKSLIWDCYSPEYRFGIIASDQGQPVRTSKTNVILHFKNQNLHPPRIILSKNDPNINLYENNKIGSLLISGAVKDKDSNRNGEFECYLQGINNNAILLQTNKTRIEDVTIISLFTNRVFDREKISKMFFSVICQDFGEPPLQSSVNLVIQILDINDNRPKFDKEFQHIKIYEENQPNYKIAQLIALDADSGENARLEYHMEWDKNKYNIDKLITVNTLGQIIAKQSLDREKFPNGFQFTVIATDHGGPALSGFTKVYIELMDINDHAPVFEKSFYNLSFAEDFGTKQKNRTVLFIKAHDADLKENGIVTYSLSKTSLLPFKLHPNTGELHSYILIDRETQPVHYYFTVFATDSPANLLYKKTATVSVSIIIEDFNDNEPVFIFPNEVNYKVQLSYLVPVGTVVTTVNAFDKDSGMNALIKYSIVDAERNILFSINESTGDLMTSTVLNSIHEGEERLFIKSSDCGSSPLTAIQRLTVVIGEFRGNEFNNKIEGDVSQESFLSDQATFIIVGIIFGTFFICCGLVTGICTMAYRQWNHTNGRTTNTQHYQIDQELNNLQYMDNHLIMKEFT